MVAPGASRAVLGLDINEQDIVLIELIGSGPNARVVDGSVRAWPGGDPGDAAARAEVIRASVRERGAAGVCVVAGGPDIVMRRMELPAMSRRELLEAVKWQMKDELPFPVHEAVLAVEPTRATVEGGVAKQEVLVVAAPQAAMYALIEPLQRAGADVVGIVPAASAVWAAMQAGWPEGRRGSVAVVELGAHATMVILARDQRIWGVRELPVGTAQFVDALVGVVGGEHGDIPIDQELAERLLARDGIVPESADGVSPEGVPLGRVAALMRPVLEQLTTELARFFDFYKLQVHESGIVRIAVCGSGSSMNGLAAALHEALGVPVDAPDPLAGLRADHPAQLRAIAPRLTRALGAALDAGSGMNLLPLELQQARRREQARDRWRAVLVRASGCAAAAVALLLVASIALSTRIKQARAAWARIEPSYRQYEALARSRAELEATTAHVQSLVDRQPLWEGLFKELSELTPISVELEELVIEPIAGDPHGAMHCRLKGRADSAAGHLSEFVDSLQHATFLSHAELISSEMSAGDNGVTRFEIETRSE